MESLVRPVCRDPSRGQLQQLVVYQRPQLRGEVAAGNSFPARRSTATTRPPAGPTSRLASTSARPRRSNKDRPVPATRRRRSPSEEAIGVVPLLRLIQVKAI